MGSWQAESCSHPDYPRQYARAGEPAINGKANLVCFRSLSTLSIRPGAQLHPTLSARFAPGVT
jgi:hypothetical protein